MGMGNEIPAPPILSSLSMAHTAQQYETASTGHASSGPPSSLFGAELNALRHLLAQHSSISTFNFTQTSSSHLAHQVSTFSSGPPWIIDSGAADHMTGMASDFSSYSLCSGKDKVRVVDGTFTSITGEGTVSAFPNLTLSSVLHVPKFTNNLLSDLDMGIRLEVNVRAMACEFMYGGLGSFFADNGIVHQTSFVDTPKQNGVAERKYHHITEVTRLLLIGMGVPKSYWADATLTTTCLINRMPSKALGYQSPFSVLHHDIALFTVPPKVIGCVCYVHIHHRNDKMDPKAIRCVFLGHSATQKGYGCYNPTTRHRFVSMDVTFFESVPFFSTTRDSVQGDDKC
ncbi:uncharacterized protein LOC132266262 [Cornus florida]|uniref:uncharacterized protein LOC132266262 n=1 Tax=Cornus florida TaxID=4283 RepID=UPI00289BEAF7|nr:uncharacterized protein LOC132266262 [Cornus florida]